MKRRLKVSFSGGKTSALMAFRLLTELSHVYEFIFIFANTGEEDEKTLRFVDNCDKAWGLNLVWVEAVVHPGQRMGSTHKVVSFETASRNGEPYEAVIQKYGISNMDFQPCNRELKLNPMKSYMSSIGWSNYETAIGIRADEKRRVNEKTAQKEKIIYPLIDIWPSDKQDIFDFWDEQPFKLGLEEHEGNCKWCWKKSDRKHYRLISERPEIYDFPRRMERLYGWHGSPHYGIDPQNGDKKRVFFRGYRSVDDMFQIARELGVHPMIQLKEERSEAARQYGLDLESGGCSESCELYPTDEVIS